MRARAWALIACVAVGGCAGTSLVLDGESRGKLIDLRLAGRLDGRGTGKVTLDVNNHADDAIGIDLDAIRLGAASQEGAAPLGRPQNFRAQDGTKMTRRVALGAATIPPNTQQKIELEFERLPPGGAYALALPTLYRMGIDGQVSLKGVRVPVHVEKQAGGPKDPEGWYDPFEDRWGAKK